MRGFCGGIKLQSRKNISKSPRIAKGLSETKRDLGELPVGRSGTDIKGAGRLFGRETSVHTSEVAFEARGVS